MTTLVLDRSGRRAEVVERETLAETVFMTVTSLTPTLEMLPQAIEAGVEGVEVRPEFMVVDRPYPFRLFGEDVVAVKRSNGAIDFYTLP